MLIYKYLIFLLSLVLLVSLYINIPRLLTGDKDNFFCAYRWSFHLQLTRSELLPRSPADHPSWLLCFQLIITFIWQEGVFDELLRVCFEIPFRHFSPPPPARRD